MPSSGQSDYGGNLEDQEAGCDGGGAFTWETNDVCQWGSNSQDCSFKKTKKLQFHKSSDYGSPDDVSKLNQTSMIRPTDAHFAELILLIC